MQGSCWFWGPYECSSCRLSIALLLLLGTLRAESGSQGRPSSHSLGDKGFQETRRDCSRGEQQRASENETRLMQEAAVFPRDAPPTLGGPAHSPGVGGAFPLQGLQLICHLQRKGFRTA